METHKVSAIQGIAEPSVEHWDSRGSSGAWRLPFRLRHAPAARRPLPKNSRGRRAPQTATLLEKLQRDSFAPCAALTKMQAARKALRWRLAGHRHSIEGAL